MIQSVALREICLSMGPSSPVKLKDPYDLPENTTYMLFSFGKPAKKELRSTRPAPKHSLRMLQLAPAIRMADESHYWGYSERPRSRYSSLSGGLETDLTPAFPSFPSLLSAHSANSPGGPQLWHELEASSAPPGPFL